MNSCKHDGVAYAFSRLLKTPEFVVFDVARRQADYVSYPSLEHLKNGMRFAEKYESVSFIFKQPTVVVFSDEMLDVTALFRNIIRAIDYGDELIEIPPEK